MELVNEFSEPAVVIIKHNNPCGVAIADNLTEAFKRAYSSDTMSAFGGVVAANMQVDLSLAKELTALFLEEIVAPDYSPEALRELARKEKVRVLKAELLKNKFKLVQFNYRDVSGGLLVQTAKYPELNRHVDQ